MSHAVANVRGRGASVVDWCVRNALLRSPRRVSCEMGVARTTRGSSKCKVAHDNRVHTRTAVKTVLDDTERRWRGVAVVFHNYPGVLHIFAIAYRTLFSKALLDATEAVRARHGRIGA